MGAVNGWRSASGSGTLERMSAATGTLSLGVAAALGPAAIAEIAGAAEAAGFEALWVNDTPGADALEALAAAASVTATLGLATGVLPLDRRPAEEIAAAATALPADRLTLGIGSGAARQGALALMAEGVQRLRAEVGCRILVGALGPRMRRLGAAEADGVLLSWLPPRLAREQAAAAHEVRPAAHVALYVRTALDPAAEERMRQEAERYAGFPSYAANFARLGIDVHDTVLPSPARDAASGIVAYRDAVDEVVLRAIVPEDTPASYLRFITTAAQLRDAS